MTDTEHDLSSHMKVRRKPPGHSSSHGQTYIFLSFPLCSSTLDAPYLGFIGLKMWLFQRNFTSVTSPTSTSASISTSQDHPGIRVPLEKCPHRSHFVKWKKTFHIIQHLCTPQQDYNPVLSSTQQQVTFLHVELVLLGAVSVSSECHIHEARVRPAGTIKEH